jgi:multimeric flavodoxin WrbA
MQYLRSLQTIRIDCGEERFFVVHVLGVSTSPRPTAAIAVLVQSALLGAAAVPDTTTEYVSLANKVITPCNGCERCLIEGRCVVDDDMQPLYERLLAADAMIIGTPAYFGSLSGLCKAFLERIEGLGVKEKRLALKVGGAITTAGSRNGGQELAAIAVNAWFHINDMLPVGITSPVAQWGATGNTGFDVQDVHRDVIKLTPFPEELGTPTRQRESLLSKELAWLYGRKIATVAKIVGVGITESGLGLPDRPYGWTLPATFPPELYDICRPTEKAQAS